MSFDSNSVSRQILEDTSWYRALHLTDRKGSAFPDLKRGDASYPLVARWRSQKPFDNAEIFDRWLETYGLNVPVFERILEESMESLKSRLSEVPDWLSQFSEIWEASYAECVVEPIEGEAATAPLLTVLAPLIHDRCRDLEIRVRDIFYRFPHMPLDRKQILSMAIPQLFKRLSRLAGRVMVLELHVARHKGLLQGNNAEERFAHFVHLLTDTAFALKILQEYPIITRLAMVVITNWSNACLEFLERLGTDWPALSVTFGLDSTSRIVELKQGAGDSHCMGRSVAILAFDQGGRIVYRPRPADIYQNLSRLFDWIERKGGPSLRLPRVIARKGYGWAEYITHAPCTALDELHLFYRRQGALLAILHLLRAMDFHNENLVAAGPHPVLIDVEFLFHLGMQGMGSLSDDTPADLMEESVMRVGLLPRRQWLKDDSEKGTDQSGIGGAAGQLSLTKIALWSEARSDNMRLERKRLPMVALPNRPSVSTTGSDLDPLFYTEDIVSGFEETYRVILASREELLADQGPLYRFRDDEVRYILRPSLVYAMMLSESHHPDLMRDALERDRFFDRLWISAATWPKESANGLEELIPAERQDLWAEDIPYFSTRVDSRDLWTSSGERIPDFLHKTGLADVRSRVLEFSEGDLRRQSWLIRAAMASLGEKRQRPVAVSPADVGPMGPERSKIIEAAAEIGERVKDLAFEDAKSGAGWIGLMTMNGKAWTLASNDLGLYSGSAGITLFLAYLAQLSDNQLFRALAERSLLRIRSFIKKWGPPRTVGAFEGTASILYLLTHLGSLWKREDLVTEARNLIPVIANQADDDIAFDVMGGSAGAIAALVAFYQTFRDEAAISSAQRLASRLVKTALPQKSGGLAWAASINPDHPLTGFSHGAAGIAWGLGKLYALTGDQGLRTIMLDALEFETNVYSEEFGGWPDFRGFQEGQIPSSPASYIASAWCHGAAGIGLGRLGLMSCLPSALLEKDFSVALHATIKSGFGMGHCLCHGDLGNLDLVLEASRQRPINGLATTLVQLTSSIFEAGTTAGWQCDTPTLIETPGLMTGLSGIGYNLLRLADPDQVPSVLLLSPPEPST